jgi:hypothetical protein
VEEEREEAAHDGGLLPAVLGVAAGESRGELAHERVRRPEAADVSMKVLT